MDKEIKRGYVKWTDSDGVFHKEPLADHPDMLATATPEQQLAAEEVRRLNEAAEAYKPDAGLVTTEEVVDALRSAPADVLTAAQLTVVDDGSGEPVVVESSAVEPTAEPASGAAEPVSEEPVKVAAENTEEADKAQEKAVDDGDDH